MALVSGSVQLLAFAILALTLGGLLSWSGLFLVRLYRRLTE
jgi:hypothetical protein